MENKELIDKKVNECFKFLWGISEEEKMKNVDFLGGYRSIIKRIYADGPMKVKDFTWRDLMEYFGETRKRMLGDKICSLDEIAKVYDEVAKKYRTK